MRMCFSDDEERGLFDLTFGKNLEGFSLYAVNYTVCTNFHLLDDFPFLPVHRLSSSLIFVL